MTCIQTAAEFKMAVFWTLMDMDTSFDNSDILHSLSGELPNSMLNTACWQVSLVCLLKNNRMISRTCSSWMAFNFYTSEPKKTEYTYVNSIYHKCTDQWKRITKNTVVNTRTQNSLLKTKNTIPQRKQMMCIMCNFNLKHIDMEHKRWLIKSWQWLFALRSAHIHWLAY